MNDFEALLSRCRGKTRAVWSADRFSWKLVSSEGYYQKACDLHAGAIVLGHTLNEDAQTVWDRYKLGRKFSIGATIPSVFALVGGLSIELMLKAIALRLDQPLKLKHTLPELCADIGIKLSKDHSVILEAMTEYVMWAGRYPAPKDKKAWERAIGIFRRQRADRTNGRVRTIAPLPHRQISLENYRSIWNTLDEFYSRASTEITER